MKLKMKNEKNITRHIEHLWFSLLRQEHPQNLTSGEMSFHQGGWDKSILEVNHLWCHRTSTQNNHEKSHLVCVLYLFCTILIKERVSFFSGFMGNESEHGTNKSRELRSGSRTICLFRAPIHSPWTQKKDTYSLYLQCFKQGPFLKFSD